MDISGATNEYLANQIYQKKVELQALLNEESLLNNEYTTVHHNIANLDKEKSSLYCISEQNNFEYEINIEHSNLPSKKEFIELCNEVNSYEFIVDKLQKEFARLKCRFNNLGNTVPNIDILSKITRLQEAIAEQNQTISHNVESQLLEKKYLDTYTQLDSQILNIQRELKSSIGLDSIPVYPTYYRDMWHKVQIEHYRSIENMLPLRWFYTLVNAHLCVLKLEASTYIHGQHSIVTSATLAAAARPEGRIMVGKIPSLCTCVHSRAESHNSEHSNILHGLTWRHKFVYVSTVNLSRFRLGQFTITRDILKQHICTLTRLLILILLLIAGIEANPGPNMHYIESKKLK